MKQKDLHYQAFSANWFTKHQRILLFVFNLVYKFLPSLFFKSGERDDFKGNKIIEVGNNHATCDAGLQFFKKSALYETASKNPENNHRTRRIYKKLLKKMLQGKIKEELTLLPARKTVFFTDWNYSKMLYNAFKPMWWAMHWWDELVADKFVPQLSFGFSTLTQYPGSIGANNPISGHVRFGGTNDTFSFIRDSTPGNVGINNDIGARIAAGTSSNGYNSMRRGIALFDTSSLTAGATIDTGTPPVLSWYVSAKSDTMSQSIGITSSAPAADNALVGGDYNVANFGSTRFSTDKTIAAINTSAYNDYTLNASGIAAISLTGISKFAIRISCDIDNSAPVWSSGADASVTVNFVTSNTPKLVVTYTVVSGPANLKSYNTNLSANIKSINTNLIANCKSLNTNV